jgi:uncharacterized cupredoxin-like copper-binding protein
MSRNRADTLITNAKEQNMKSRLSSTAAMLLAAIAAASAQPALGHGDQDHSNKAKAQISRDEHPWGREGDPKRAARTIVITMSDAMRYSPDRLDVKKGETVTFVVENKGKVMHELVIGTDKDLKAHAEMMRKHPGMEHDEPFMAHVAPGKRRTLTWQFTRDGEFLFGCLVPGHFEAGMIGRIKVSA